MLILRGSYINMVPGWCIREICVNISNSSSRNLHSVSVNYYKQREALHTVCTLSPDVNVNNFSLVAAHVFSFFLLPLKLNSNYEKWLIVE